MQSIGSSYIHILLLISIWFIPYDSIRLGSQKIPSWVVVWSHWCRPRKPQLFFYMVLTGPQNMQDTNLVYTFYAQVILESHCIVFQLMSRMEICITIAWGIWYWDMGHWHSWLGFLWFRFVLLLFLLYVITFRFVHEIFNMLSSLFLLLFIRKTSSLWCGIQAWSLLPGTNVLMYLLYPPVIVKPEKSVGIWPSIRW